MSSDSDWFTVAQQYETRWKNERAKRSRIEQKLKIYEQALCNVSMSLVKARVTMDDMIRIHNEFQREEKEESPP